jgi:hypothetical protein
MKFEENKKIKIHQDIRDIEIDYEVEDNFKNDLLNKDITDSLNDIELVDIIDFSEESKSEPQISFDFEMSLDDINEKNKFDLDDSNKEISSNINNSYENTIFEKSNEIDFEKKENNDLLIFDDISLFESSKSNLFFSLISSNDISKSKLIWGSLLLSSEKSIISTNSISFNESVISLFNKSFLKLSSTS